MLAHLYDKTVCSRLRVAARQTAGSARTA